VLVETPVRNLDNAYSSKSVLWQWDCKRPAVPLISSELLTICFEARKTSTAPVRFPQQGAWSHAVSPSQFGSAPAPRQSLLGKLREALVRVSPRAMSLVGPVKRILGRDLSRKPWGLRSVGRV
jgi:hypothetical protein